MGKWRTVRLGELAQIHKEQLDPREARSQLFQHFSLPAFDAGRGPIIEKGSSIESQKFTVPHDAILISKLNPRTKRVWEPSFTQGSIPIASTEFVVLIPKQRTDRKFLKYVCLSPGFYEVMRSMVTGTSGSHQRVRPEDVLGIEVCVPEDIDEQKSIAKVLSGLDDKIELNRKMNETLEEMARAIYKSWFVDFEPVRAKGAGISTGYPQEISNLFPSRLVDSELGPIPEGWRVGTVGDLCSAIYSGGTPNTQKSEYWKGDLLWLSSGETRDKFIINTEKRITLEGVSNSSTRLASALSTVIASAGQGSTRGQTSLLNVDSYINQSVVVLFADKHASSPYHLFFDLERRYEEFRRISDAHSSRGSLTTKLLAQLGAVLPPSEVIREFDRMVSSAVSRIVESRRETCVLAAFRDSLLPKIMSREIRVDRE